MSFSPMENRCRSIVKALALLATFTRYREMENEGDKTGHGEWREKRSASVIFSFRRMKLINFSGELNFHYYCINRYLASLRT